MTLDPTKHDHLWDWGAPYLIAAIDQETFSEFGVWDFISYGINDEISLYLSKKDGETLSEKGILLYTTEFQKYENTTRKDMRIMEDLLVKSHSTNLTQCTNQQLAVDFEQFVSQIYKIFKNYDPTECMYTSKIEEILVGTDTKYDVKKLQENIKKMGAFKLDQRELMNRSWNYKTGPLGKYLDAISSRTKLKFSPVQYHYKELLDLLNNKKVTVPNRSIWIRGQFSSWKDVTGNDAKNFINQLGQTPKNVQIISGTVSSRGHYIGRVRKILFDIKTNYIKEIEKMESGEVLVSGSTGPEMILACKKAGAIVADEGGVISHAAIISRELGIPCITGTHIAYKSLETGDLIEVDAINGVIKILKRADYANRI